MVLAGKRYYPVGIHAPLFSFTVALLISTCSILSIGFLIASIVPTARFAQPIGAVIMYPMMAVSGLFAPVESLPPALQAVAKVVPLTYAVSLLEGIWKGDAWSAHMGDIAALAWCLSCALRFRRKCFAGSSYTTLGLDLITLRFSRKSAGGPFWELTGGQTKSANHCTVPVPTLHDPINDVMNIRRRQHDMRLPQIWPLVT
jgi:hypothetical protein